LLLQAVVVAVINWVEAAVRAVSALQRDIPSQRGLPLRSLLAVAVRVQLEPQVRALLVLTACLAQLHQPAAAGAAPVIVLAIMVA
jgi:hypothetical protein